MFAALYEESIVLAIAAVLFELSIVAAMIQYFIRYGIKYYFELKTQNEQRQQSSAYQQKPQYAPTYQQQNQSNPGIRQ